MIRSQSGKRAICSIKNNDNGHQCARAADCRVLQNASDSVSYKFAKEDFRIRPVAYLAMRTTSLAPVLRVPRSCTPYLDRKIRLEGFVHTDDVWVAHIELCKVTPSCRAQQ